MIKLENISLKINNHILLNNLSIHADPGDFIIVIGHNGAGKSSLLKVISGQLNINSGKILVDGKDISKLTQQQRSCEISLVNQDPQIGTIGSMTSEENLALALYKCKKIGLRNGLKILENSNILTTFNRFFANKDLLKKEVCKLSGGQKQILAAIMATAASPKILLLDEPTAALDPNATDQIMEFINQIAKENKLIIIMVTHDLDNAIKLGNKLWIMKEGKIYKTLNDEKKELNVEQIKYLLS